MVATFNGWDEMPEVEREALEVWEQERIRDDEEILSLRAATEMPGGFHSGSDSRLEEPARPTVIEKPHE
jgi:hypothetical protein